MDPVFEKRTLGPRWEERIGGPRREDREGSWGQTTSRLRQYISLTIEPPTMGLSLKENNSAIAKGGNNTGFVQLDTTDEVGTGGWDVKHVFKKDGIFLSTVSPFQSYIESCKDVACQ
jgi:hypothetical protein